MCPGVRPDAGPRVLHFADGAKAVGSARRSSTHGPRRARVELPEDPRRLDLQSAGIGRRPDIRGQGTRGGELLPFRRARTIHHRPVRRDDSRRDHPPAGGGALRSLVARGGPPSLPGQPAQGRSARGRGWGGKAGRDAAIPLRGVSPVSPVQGLQSRSPARPARDVDAVRVLGAVRCGLRRVDSRGGGGRGQRLEPGERGLLQDLPALGDPRAAARRLPHRVGPRACPRADLQALRRRSPGARGHADVLATGPVLQRQRRLAVSRQGQAALGRRRGALFRALPLVDRDPRVAGHRARHLDQYSRLHRDDRFRDQVHRELQPTSQVRWLLPAERLPRHAESAPAGVRLHR